MILLKITEGRTLATDIVDFLTEVMEKVKIDGGEVSNMILFVIMLPSTPLMCAENLPK